MGYFSPKVLILLGIICKVFYLQGIGLRIDSKWLSCIAALCLIEQFSVLLIVANGIKLICRFGWFIFYDGTYVFSNTYERSAGGFQRRGA